MKIIVPNENQQNVQVNLVPNRSQKHKLLSPAAHHQLWPETMSTKMQPKIIILHNFQQSFQKMSKNIFIFKQGKRGFHDYLTLKDQVVFIQNIAYMNYNAQSSIKIFCCCFAT